MDAMPKNNPNPTSTFAPSQRCILQFPRCVHWTPAPFRAGMGSIDRKFA